MNTAINRVRLFNASCVALVVTALAFATRGSFVTEWGREFSLIPTEVGWITGTAFWGFTIAMAFGGMLVDVIGMKRIFAIAFICHLVGIIMTVCATGFWTLFISTLFIGLANGSVEAAANPLITSIYPDEKTRRLNRFHAWFPWGIVIGGLLVYGLNLAKITDWRWAMGIMLLPTFVYGWMFFSQKFPQTERVTSGVSYKGMLKACTSPLFLFMAFCMLFTAATELGTNQWIAALVSNVMAHPILVLVWVTGIMALARSFGGAFVHNIKHTAILISSAALGCIGLLILGYSVDNFFLAMLGAAIFGLGVAFFWPTMLGFVSEKIPATGALGLSLMGGIGFLGAAIAQPVLGNIYETRTQLLGSELAGGASTLLYVAIVPAALVVAFLVLYVWQRKR